MKTTQQERSFQRVAAEVARDFDGVLKLQPLEAIRLIDDADRGSALESGVYAELGRCTDPQNCAPCSRLRAMLEESDRED